MLISEKNKSIDFNVIGYEFPREKKSLKKEFNYDANWLSLKIHYQDGKKEKTYITPCLLTYELSELINVFRKSSMGNKTVIYRILSSRVYLFALLMSTSLLFSYFHSYMLQA